MVGSGAQYRGDGYVNGVPGYKFTLTATDGQAPNGGGTDKFRIRIWDSASGVVIYDNVRGAGEATNVATRKSSEAAVS